jgi:hypothetical protein
MEEVWNRIRLVCKNSGTALGDPPETPDYLVKDKKII